ncbi:MAG: hypothetical protein IKX00_03400 [Bacilli bacterium]|nr:hypothetical protein [Bacilli bacterium]
MEERPNMFNRTSRTYKEYAESCLKDIYGIITSSTGEEEREKTASFEKFLLQQKNLQLSLISEKAFEFCKNNLGKGFVYTDDGIMLESIKNDVNAYPINTVFIDLHQYILFATYYNYFKEKLFKETSYQTGKNIIESDFDIPSEQDTYSFEEMYSFVDFLGSTYKYAFNSKFYGVSDKAEHYVKILLSEYSLPQLNRFIFYVESLCDLINQGRHIKDVFEQQLKINIEDIYSNEVAEKAFLVRNIAEKLREEIYSKKNIDLDNSKTDDDNARTRNNN